MSSPPADAAGAPAAGAAADAAVGAGADTAAGVEAGVGVGVGADAAAPFVAERLGEKNVLRGPYSCSSFSVNLM